MKFGMKKLFKMLLLQSQLTVEQVLISLDRLNLMRIFNFLDIFQKHCSVSIISNFNMC